MEPDTTQPPTLQRPHTLRNGIFCCLIFLACLALVWPFTKMGFIDDWSYLRTAQLFVKTGHMVYNGWADPMLGWMVPWGALFIKLFGSSFIAVRLSILPIALSTLLLFHAILIRFGATPRNAILGTLTLGLSPLLLPLAVSYMTDVPCLFVVVLCLYFCQRAASAHSAQTAIVWLALAAASNVAGGTVRQAAWLGALVMVPCTGWLLRKQRSVFFASLALWLASVAAIFYGMHWFSLQPYAPQVHLLPKAPSSILLGVYEGIVSLNRTMALFLCLLLGIFPILVAWLPHFGKKFDHYIALFCMGLLPMLMLKYLCGNLGVIWPESDLDVMFSRQKHVSLGVPLYAQHSLFPITARILISVVTIAALFGWIIAVRKKGWKAVRAQSPTEASQIFWLLVPFTASYFLLLLLAVLHGLTLDKYVLDVMPFAIAGSIWFYQRDIRTELPAASVALLAVYTVIAVAGTHTWFASHRARLAAIHELRAAGVPRTEIQAGYEYDGWTQISSRGHMNNRLIKVPSNAYHPPTHKSVANNLCDYNLLTWAPVLHPRYAVGFGQKDCYLPSEFPPVHFTAWIPPFHRAVDIQKVPKTRPVILAKP